MTGSIVRSGLGDPKSLRCRKHISSLTSNRCKCLNYF